MANYRTGYSIFAHSQAIQCDFLRFCGFAEENEATVAESKKPAFKNRFMI